MEQTDAVSVDQIRKSGGLAIDLCFGHPANSEMYRPGSKRIPESGSWIMVIRKPPPIPGNELIRPGRVFFAERAPGSDRNGFQNDGTYKVVIHGLPRGDVYLWPYEYLTAEIGWVISEWAQGELEFHPLRVESARLSFVSFYARSRGIGLEDAAVMALGTVTGPVGWFDGAPPIATEVRLNATDSPQTASR